MFRYTGAPLKVGWILKNTNERFQNVTDARDKIKAIRLTSFVRDAQLLQLFVSSSDEYLGDRIFISAHAFHRLIQLTSQVLGRRSDEADNEAFKIASKFAPQVRF